MCPFNNAHICSNCPFFLGTPNSVICEFVVILLVLSTQPYRLLKNMLNSAACPGHVNGCQFYY